MKRIGIYCQHLLGVGHLTRCLALAQGFLQQAEVYFIQGGNDIGRRIDHPSFHHHFLKPIQMEEETSRLFSPVGEMATVWQQRQVQLSQALKWNLDAVIVELYPFGRKKFAAEINHWIDSLKELNPSLLIYCSLRDILVAKPDWDRRQEKTLQALDDRFSGVLVHSDPNLVPLELTFSREKEISVPVVYTGYISTPVSIQKQRREQSIIVSIGGGIVGEELIVVALEVSDLRPEIQWTFIKSPNMSTSLIERLSSVNQKNIRVLDFVPNYQELLCEHSLSISMGGYNTTMDLLQTRTYGLVYPYQRSTEQKLRTNLLNQKDVVRELVPEDLNGRRLAQTIDKSWSRSDWRHVDIQLSGVNKTRECILSGL